MTKKNNYLLQDTPFYKLRSKKRLAEIIGISLKELLPLTEGEHRYKNSDKQKKSGGLRLISNPIEPLKKTQSRIAKLLSRVKAPDYLFSAVSGRSYVDNAAYHVGATTFHLLDIENFFPNCTINKALWFFSKKLQCSPDVATILAKIVTFRGVLPQGSPCSPILAYFCYIDMWDEIEFLVKSYQCRLSVYVDDITISGDIVLKELIWGIKKIIVRHGHKYAKDKERTRHHQKAEITGVIVGKDGVSAPHRQYKKLYKKRAELSMKLTGEEKKKLNQQIQGRLAQIRQIENSNHSLL